MKKNTVDPLEIKFLDILLLRFPHDKTFTFFDVGANVGDYTFHIVNNCNSIWNGHLFEPIPELCDGMKGRFKHVKNVKINNFGVDDEIKERTFTVSAQKVCSSFSGRVGGKKITVNTITLPHYVETNNIPHIDLLKIDTEGHEKKILDSCVSLFEENKISIIQFEYGGTWKGTGWSGGNVYEVFDLLTSHNFNMYKSIDEGLQSIDNGSFENNFKSYNLLAIHNSVTFLDEIL